MEPLVWIVVVIVAFLVGSGIGYAVRKSIAEAKIGAAETRALHIIESAQKDVEAKQKEMLLEAKDEAHRIRQEAEREGRERRAELQKLERRILQKEEAIDKKLESLDKRSELLREKERLLEEKQADIEALYQQQVRELERISGLTQEAAREHILSAVERESRHDAAVLMKEIEQQARQEAEKKLATSSRQRCSAVRRITRRRSRSPW
ncbi:hypothetical protein GCM10025857_02610 [Alicyclobacillus contaminans]|nr:hypothetical protein GCM10025857_02610 [Alicyclobacillus contaminans]